MLRSLTTKQVLVKPIVNATGYRFGRIVKNDAAEAIEAGLGNIYGPDQSPHPISHYWSRFAQPEKTPSVKPWTLPNRYWNIREKPTSEGERKPTELTKKWLNDTQYQLYRESIGYNEFADTIPVSRIRQRYLQNIWSKNYFRDERGHAVVPDRFKNVDRKGLESYLKKADHYFFAQNLPPKLRVFTPVVPVGWPEDTLDAGIEPDALPGAKSTTKEDHDNPAPSKVPMHRKMYDLIAGGFSGENEPGAEIQYALDKKKLRHVMRPEHSSSTKVRRFWEDRENFISERVRRVREWQKFLMRMKYVAHLNTKRVSCVRSIGRDAHIVTLFIMGDGEGFFSYGIGKGLDENDAYRRAMYACRKNALYIPLLEKRTLFQDATFWFGQSRVRLFGLHRGAGFTCSQRHLSWFKSIGIKDGGMKLTGTRNMYCLVKAFMKCLEIQRSYRDIAFGRGVDFRRLHNPYHKTPPAPSHEDIKDLEAEAAKNFSKAVTEVMNKRGMLETRTFAPLKAYFLNYDRDAYEKAWDSTFDAKNVPKSARVYPSFTDFVDASSHIASLDGPLTQPDSFSKNTFDVDTVATLPNVF